MVGKNVQTRNGKCFPEMVVTNQVLVFTYLDGLVLEIQAKADELGQ